MATDTTRISDLVLGRLSPEESIRLLEEIERDPAASAELEVRARLLAEIQRGGEFLFAGSRSGAFARATRPSWAGRILAPAPLIAATLFLIVLLPIASLLSRGPYVEMARVDSPQYEAVLRSADGSDIDLAVRMLRSGHLTESLLLLERFCRAYPESSLRQYAHYLAGAIYLSDARTSILGMFVSYDASRVQAGLTHLEEAIHSAGTPRLVEESHWLRAKGFLMIEKPGDAITELTAVRRLEGLRSTDAAELLEKIWSRE